jgi:hypothetical protein
MNVNLLHNGDMTAVETLETNATDSCCVPSGVLGQPTGSHHPRIRVHAGLLKREKRGTWTRYSLVTGAVDSVAVGIAGL